MPLILNLETATKTCSVALAEGLEILAVKEMTSEQFSHAEKLNLFIEEVLRDAGKEMKDLEAVAVSAGPGSYTGLRIGTSAAKGMCYALEIPLIAVNSLKALARMVEDERTDLICPMFDARRSEVYAAIYDKELNELEATNAKVLDGESYSEELGSKRMLFVGPGAVKTKDIITNENALFNLDLEVSAKGMVPLSFHKFEQEDFVDVAYFEPAYLKDFVAGTPKKVL